MADVISNYEFLEKLGEGSFGEVWLAYDKRLGEKVALKYLHLEKTSEDYLELFKREFEILSEIRHTNLARVFDFAYSQDKDQYFFTSEYCPGVEFLEAARDKPLEYVEEMVVQILAALDYVHSQGIIHFDIKSENILVADEKGHPHVKILDFGIAAKLKSLPQEVAGTPSYMAPEIMIKGIHIDHRVDLYSLGMLLLRTLTGKLPFDTQNIEEVLQWHLKGELPDEIWKGSDLPRYMREMIEKLIEKKPPDRFSNARVVLHFLNLSTGHKYVNAEKSLEGKIPREGPLVEREEILESLRDAFNASIYSSAESAPYSVQFISGAQGMGKTRILDEMRHMIELKEIPFLDIVCDWQIPAWPRLENWLNLKNIIADEMSEEWQMRVRIDAIIEKAKKKPFCLLIDEFHKADRITKSLIPELAKKIAIDRLEERPTPLFIIAATEETAAGGITLKRISAAGIAKYISLVLGTTEQGKSVAKLLQQYSGGLPLLMVEGLRFLAPHLYRNEPLENLLPPPQIGLLYRDKIKTLKPDENELLSVLALMFRPATKTELSTILEKTTVRISGLADACMRNELITGGETFQVSSQALSLDIIRYIEPEKSRFLHHRIAIGLEKIPATPLNEIAYHTAKGGEVDKAISYYRDAAIDYKEHHQVSTATDCLVRAIDICQPGAPAWKALLQDAAQLLIVSGSYREAEQYLNKLNGETTSIAEELKGLIALKKRDLLTARKKYETAIALLPRDNKLQTVLLKNSLANVALQERNFDEAENIFRQTLIEEKELSSDERAKVTNNSLGLVLAFKGDTEGAIRFYEEELAETDPERTADIVSLENGLGYVLFVSSRYEEAIPHLRRAMELSEKSGAMHALFSSMGNLIGALLKEALYSESLPLLQKMRQYQERLGTIHDLALNLLREGSVYLTVGMEEAAHECFIKGRKLAQELGDTAIAAWFILMEGYREKEYGDPHKAKELFMTAGLEGEEQKDTDLRSWAHYSIADLSFDLGEEKETKYHLNLITDPPHDDEFRIRLNLVRAKLANPASEREIDEIFAPLEKQCIDDKLQELLWEVYYSWARSVLEYGNRALAVPLLLKGIKVIETISSALPEEYRDRYLKQNARQKLFREFKKLTEPTKAAKAPSKSKIHATSKKKPKSSRTVTMIRKK